MKELEIPAFDGTVLVCDDNNMNLMLIGEHLKLVGLDVIVALNGSEAVKKVQERAQSSTEKSNDIYNKDIIEQFDLIFMDIHMPVMDGVEAAANIKKINSNIPIIAITTDKKFKEQNDFYQSDFDDFLDKPFKMHELLDCLKKYLPPNTL